METCVTVVGADEEEGGVSWGVGLLMGGGGCGFNEFEEV